MADLTAVKDDQRQNGELVAVALAAVKVFKGALLTFNASGFADVGDANERFAGVAVETVDNSGGAAGAKVVRVWRRGVVSVGCSGATQATVGSLAYVSDDQTVTFTGGAGAIPIGTVVGFVSATEVRVDINVTAPAFATPAS